jgi:endonuclease/exonuclease/phosphatase family metal-dependent hydrolase
MAFPTISLNAIAPKKLGAIFLFVTTLALGGCEKSETPDWDVPGDEAPPPAAAAAAVAAPDETPEPAPAGDAENGEARLRFIAYNVENWLTMDRYKDGESSKNAPKPDDEKAAVIGIISRHQPDILGLCEIGTAEDLAEIQEKLKGAGCDLPHLHYTSGTDPVRRLGLLSKYPITATHKPAISTFRMNGGEFGINRGILDATVTAKGKSYRFIGVHLKSKREVKEYDQEQFRINEARLLRQHVDAILEADENARLVVYGDFNDTRPTSAFRTVTGQYNAPGYLTAIPAKDGKGHAWTHHWAPHDIYSRIDFVTVSRALRTEVDFRASRIIDVEDLDKGSDHRPILALFR